MTLEFDLPRADDAELGLIGAAAAAAADRNAGKDVADVVVQVGGAALVDDFSPGPNRDAWKLICARSEAGLQIDAVSLVGDPRFNFPGVTVAELARSVESFWELATGFPALAPHYAAEIRDAATRRRLLTAVLELARRSREERRPCADWLPDALVPLETAMTSTPTLTDLSGSINAVMGHVGELVEAGLSVTLGVPTGIRQLDRLTGGLRAGQLLVIGARPSIGKSALAACFALGMAQRGYPVAIVTLEMSQREFTERLLSQLAQVELTRIWRGPLRGFEHERLVQAADRLSRLAIFVDDDALDLPAIIGRMQQRVAQGVRVVILDYLQLVHVHEPHLKGWERIGVVTRQMKGFAKRHNLPVIALAQINREGVREPGKRPGMADLRGSGDIEQDADVVALIHRPGAHDPTADSRAAELIIDKHRGGPRGVIDLRWVPELAQFTDVSAFENQEPDDRRYAS